MAIRTRCRSGCPHNWQREACRASRKLGSGIIGNPITWKVGGKQYVGIYSGIGGWIGLPMTAGLDLGDKFGAIGATATTKAAGLQHIPQGGELNVFRLFE